MIGRRGPPVVVVLQQAIQNLQMIQLSPSEKKNQADVKICICTSCASYEVC